MSGLVSRLWPLALALLLGSSVPSLAAGAALAADETPDLVVELVSASSQVAELKVTNKSENWADETTMVVQAIGQQLQGTMLLPNQLAQSFFIENLDPGQSTTVVFTLPIPCIQHSLIVTVGAAGNWEDVKETNLANNTITVPLCVSTTASEPKIDYGFGSGGCARCDENKPKPGPTTVDIPLEKSNSELYQDGWEIPNGTRGRMRVGFVQREGNLINDTQIGIAKLGIRFDRAKLLAFKGIRITNATITYDEKPDTLPSGHAWWTSGSGSPQDKPGCVYRIMIATEPVDSPSGLKYQFYANHDPASRFIDVTDATIDFIGERNSGLVLLGAFDKVDGDDSTSCMSELTNLVLHVTTGP